MIKYVVFTVCLLAASVLKAQDKFSLGLELNPKINLMTSSYPAEYEFEQTLSYGAYLMTNYQVSKNVVLHGGVGYDYLKIRDKDYSFKFGSDIDPTTGFNNTTYLDDEITIHYFSIPIGASLAVGAEKKSFFGLGVTTQIPMGDKREGVFVSQTDPSVDGTEMNQFTVEAPQTQFQVNLIFKRDITISKEDDFSFGLKLDFGASQTFDIEFESSFANRDWRSSGIGLVLGYRLF